MTLEGKLRAIALAAIVRPSDGALLVQRGYDASKMQVFYRPLGGGVEFGETSEEAVRREMVEELGASVRPVRKLGTIESIFTHNGVRGHEIAIVWLVDFVDRSLYLEDTLPYREGDHQSEAQWVHPFSLKAQGIPLFPDGLTELLKSV